jgi:hypothetical protein
MEAIDPLIAHMEKEEGRVHEDIHDALRRISRDDLGSESARWKAWWTKEKERSPNKLPPRPAEKPKDDANARYAPDKPAFYGTQLYSKRLAFLLDVSTSMSDHIVVDPAWLQRLGRQYRNDATKFDLSVAEISATLKSVDPRMEFGIITFRSEVKSWKEHLVTAGSGVVEQAIGYLGSQEPPTPAQSMSDIGKQKTNLADALRIALGIKPGTSGRPSDEGADEAFVMTDGQPTAGDLVDADVLISWFKERNRSVRLRLHVVTFETVDVDLSFLQSLARAGGGGFTAIPAVVR